MNLKLSERVFHLALAIVTTVTFGCASLTGHVAPVERTRADEVADFRPVRPDRWTLPNGLQVIFLKDPELPVVKGRLFLRAGALWADRYPIGTTSAMGDGMRMGGAGELSADALDKELDKLAAGISSSFSAEFGGVTFSCLSADVDRVFELFSDVTLRPRFDSERLALWKGQSLEGIRRRVEDPSTVASIAFTQIAYGESPYGRVSTSRDISSITRSDMIELHQRFVRPDGAILVVTGDIDRSNVEALATKYFGAWKPRGSVMPPPPEIKDEPKPGVYFITLPFQQASVKLGHLGVPRFTPDYPDIDVFNEIFGSAGFGSRLMKRVRTELGLTYGVSGAIVPGLVKGTNYVFLQTKANSVGAAIDESIEVLEQLQQNEPRGEELSERKEAIANSYIFNFSSADDIAGRVARQELLQYPSDYDQTYLPKIESVTARAVSEVARNRWNPAKLLIVIVGNEQAYANLETERAKPESAIRSLPVSKLRFNEAVVMQ
jgi:zinc protease